MDGVCVLGVPDPYSGEVSVALVVLGDEAKERAERDDKEVKNITISILKARSATALPACDELIFWGSL